MNDNKILGTIVVQNNSTSATDAQVQNWIAASKIQCDRDVLPIWGYTFQFVFVSKDQMTKFIN